MIPGVTFRQIEAFYWCVRLKSFSAAAGRLHTTQPGISGRIRDLESLIGATLFERTGRSVRVTQTGRDLFEVAERFIALGEEFVGRLRLEREFSGTIRIGAADTIAFIWLPRLVSRLAELYPRLDVELVVDLSLHLQERLRTGEIDVGFMVSGLPGPEFINLPLGETANRWTASPKLGFPEDAVGAEDLAAFPILTHSRGSHLYRVIQSWFEACGARPSRVHGCNSLATMIQMTIAGLGVSVLPPVLLTREFAEGQLRTIRTERALPPNLFVACWPARTPGAITRAVVELAVEVAKSDLDFSARLGRGLTQATE